MPLFRNPPWRVRSTMRAQDMSQVWPWGMKFAGVDKLWQSTQGDGVLGCILDTGYDATHPDLAGQVVGSQDFSGSAYGVDDRQGHGTHTLGTQCACDNGIGVIGVAPKLKMLVGKVLGDDGSGSSSAVTAGIQWAQKEKADYISMSLGSAQGDPAIYDALQAYVADGGLVICAAGNDGREIDPQTGQELDTIGYPAKWGDVAVAVGAYDEQGNIASFSSRGPELDVIAPGVNVLSTWPGGKYAYLDGTSMATPFVAGCIALILAARKSQGLPKIASEAELKRSLFAAAIPQGSASGTTNDWGHGFINPGGMFDDLTVTPSPNTPAIGSSGDPNTIQLGPFNVYGLFSVEAFVTLLNPPSG